MESVGVLDVNVEHTIQNAACERYVVTNRTTFFKKIMADRIEFEWENVKNTRYPSPKIYIFGPLSHGEHFS